MMTTQEHKEKGRQAEKVAQAYLEARQLYLIDRNYSCRYGEIDLIMQDKKILVFIEVRSRQTSAYGSSIETVDPHKQSRIIRSASHYLQSKHLYDQVDCRFDVVGLNKVGNIVWIKDAFQVEY